MKALVFLVGLLSICAVWFFMGAKYGNGVCITQDVCDAINADERGRLKSTMELVMQEGMRCAEHVQELKKGCGETDTAAQGLIAETRRCADNLVACTKSLHASTVVIMRMKKGCNRE